MAMYSDKKGKRMLQTSGNPALETIGGRIKAARKARGLRLGAVATQIGVSRTSFSQWEADAVKKPDVNKLGKFVELVEVSLDWLVERKGNDPDLTIPQASRRRRSSGKSVERAATPGNSGSPFHEMPIPEVAATLTAHANGMDMTPKALWAIPHQVLEIGFHAEPETTVIKRIVTRGGTEFGLSRGDYVLIDTSRTWIDEPGTYIIADPEGVSAQRVLVAEDGGKLKVVAVADDLQRSNPQVAVDNLKPLGRVMGIFKPI